MAKTRLLVSTKDRLRRFAEKTIASPQEEKALERAYQKARKLLTPFILTKYPEADMAILTKYGKSVEDKCVRCSCEGGYVVQFDFKSEDAPTVPQGYCSSRNYVISKVCLNAIEDWLQKRDDLERVKTEAFKKYRAVIEASRYAEDLMVLWPASSEILDVFIKSRKQNLPAAVSPETLDFVRKDNAGAQLEAA